MTIRAKAVSRKQPVYLHVDMQIDGQDCMPLDRKHGHVELAFYVASD